ncbi:MAG: hypothetical protein IJY24_07275, partial [Clostridia bacterium]|nr:hypothetical protein [Clostridia bacterium]
TFSGTGIIPGNPFSYMNFDGVIEIELFVVDSSFDISGGSYLGALSESAVYYTSPLKIEPAPSLTVAPSVIEIAAGSVFQATVAIDGSTTTDFAIEAYLFQRARGELVYTEDCSRLIEMDDIYIAEDGKVTLTGGGSMWVIDNAIMAPISINATPGIYYLVIVYSNRYVVTPVIVTPAA